MRSSMFLLFIAECLLIFVSAALAYIHGDVFSNLIAAQIVGGSQVAEQVARENSLTYFGQIGSLADYYLFEHPRIRKRSSHESNHSHIFLDNKNVLWSQQQKLLTRVKRNLQLSSPNNYMWSDPLYKKQWYLHKVSGKSISDMNVELAWQAGYTGQGVFVSILDDGLQKDHPDLKNNYDNETSFDLNNNNSDPTPRNDEHNKHGTRCAGEISAAANNEICGVGVAYNSKIGGVKLLDGDIHDALEAAALSFRSDRIDIYSASWGPDDNGRTVDGPGPLAKRAFENGVQNGRQGLGSVYVWASGNGGKNNDSCSCDGYASSIYTISVSSADEYGTKPWYVEECPSTLTTTYSSGNTFQDAIVTTDAYSTNNLQDACTEKHTGTSASAPIVAGILALALEANKHLTWRDLQHLIVRSSNPEVLDDDWNINGAGWKVSSKFGFGLLDSWKLVQQAKTWQPDSIGIQRICQLRSQEPNEVITSESFFTISTKACRNTVNQTAKLEHVQVVITIAAQRRGNIVITLTSPMNTTSVLLPQRSQDDSSQGFLNWAFTSVHYWDENPSGRWILKINYLSDPRSQSFIFNQQTLLRSWRLVFYGSNTSDISSSRSSNASDVDVSKILPVTNGYGELTT